MGTKLEVETKFELDEAGFERLKAVGRVARWEEQLNVYYDSRWLLAKRSATFRIRFRRGDAPVLTLKLPVSCQNGRRVMQEFELPLSQRDARRRIRCSTGQVIDVASQLPQEISDQLAGLGVAFLERVGWVRNARCILEISGMGRVELDRTSLPDGRIVYEVEVETEDQMQHDILCDFVCRTVPSARPSAMSKFQRFRRAVLALGA